MAQSNEGATESIESVQFSFMTNEEVHKLSFVKITNPILLDNVHRPVPRGLYDPAMGSLDEASLCKTCGQRSFYCSGHCGHIELVSALYNPMLFNTMYNILKKTCFYCHHLLAGPGQVKKRVAQMKLVAQGDVAGARELILDSSHDDDETESLGPPNLKPEQWTSLQFTEALSILNSLPNPKSREGCQYCQGKVVKLKKPTFGWLHLEAKSGNEIRANVLRGATIKDSAVDGDSMSEEVIDESPLDDDTPAKSRKTKVAEVPAEYLKQKKVFSGGSLLPTEVKGILKLLWENEVEFFSLLGDIHGQGIGSKVDYTMFFIDSVLVPPIKFRPPSKGGDLVMEHPHTILLTKVLEANIALRNAHLIEGEEETRSTQIVRRWMNLQQALNIMFDNKTALTKNSDQGITQLLEKKEGLFRQKMMGKRVNFACRSVISPDPYLAVNEIGIPPYFALRLTYPERVTPWNVGKLRESIVNGPDIHPGATHYIDRSATVKLPPSRKSRIATSRKLPSSRGVVVQNGKTIDNEPEGKIVLRHLQDGDIVLVNRQPTLHKPSIMAHVVKVLKGERTIRMHYANCSTYNADFDGDEMNVHFPQDEISRAEGYNILNANNQYVKPTSGEPIRALIQDHVVGAVLLSKKDTFLTRDEFNQLLFSTNLSLRGSSSSSTKLGKKVCVSDFEDEIQSVMPAIWKPEPLWTGKQVITALLDHVTRGSLPFSVEKGGKLPAYIFKSNTDDDMSRKKEGDKEKKISKRRKSNSESARKKELTEDNPSEKSGLKFKEDFKEDTLLIYKNNFVRGVMDKAQFGDYGIVHTVHELYGSNTAGLLLSAFSRLFTAYLQMHGFTCGLDDLLIEKSHDSDRKKQLQKCEDVGEEVHCGFVGINDKTADPFALQLKIEKIVRNNGEAALATLDRRMISQLNDITSKSEELKGLLSNGLYKPPSKNCISLMTTSGAKGGIVNFQQISSHLGQQELEGKRVPRMVSGKTLPCFSPWDWASRAGGLIVDRFLSGLRPQEFYFHCMAGREGLVDTAVKTSRSGYLQRCLIKNLESLKVSYDHTVRDADGSIIQFQYGEDGIDVHQSSFLSHFPVLTTNEEMIRDKCFRRVDKSNPYIKMLPAALEMKALNYLKKLSSEQHQNISSKEDFLKLVEHKFMTSLAQPGEPVGVLAAQSVGEPSTQMTLNTFHLAGRGEMNVTLGIPRLTEILMTAAVNIKTPFMTCPMLKGTTEDDAEIIVRKLTKVSVASLIEGIEVSMDPFSVREKNRCRIYKLKMKCRSDTVSKKDWKQTLTVDYVRALEDAIEHYFKFVKRMRGISDFADSKPEGSGTEDETVQPTAGEEEDEDTEKGEGTEELGSDAQKRKRQGTDEMDYEENSEGEEDEKEVEEEDEEANDNDDEVTKDGGIEALSENGYESESEVPEEKTESKINITRVKGLIIKNSDRRIFVKAKKFSFEIHFRFATKEPHILLAQIAQKAAATVFIQKWGKIDSCNQITCKESQVIYYGKDPKIRAEIPAKEKENIPALQTSGVDFKTFWQFDDALDVRYIYSNDIHVILNTFGIEAARETIIREVTNVFKSYGISVNIRHLTLIADYMTHTGVYRPMNRHGGIADSTSPFGKMTFETASKFIVEAAYYRQVDCLETPSSRICLGLPAKVGTGCFDLLHKTEFDV